MWCKKRINAQEYLLTNDKLIFNSKWPFLPQNFQMLKVNHFWIMYDNQYIFTKICLANAINDY